MQGSDTAEFATFHDLALLGEGTGAILRFTTNIPEVATPLLSRPIEVRVFAGGDGTSEAPFLIESPVHLANMSKDLTAHYKLNAGIEMSKDLSFYEDAGGWVPIGTLSDPFKGTFDGNGHTISDLRIERHHFIS